MRRFGRQCRGMGKVFVTLVRQTETPLLEVGQQVLPLARAAQECLHGMTPLTEDQQVRLDIQLTAAREAHDRVPTPIATTHTEQGLCLTARSSMPTIPPSPPFVRAKATVRPVWPQARDYCRTSGGLSLCPASARGESE